MRPDSQRVKYACAAGCAMAAAIACGGDGGTLPDRVPARVALVVAPVATVPAGAPLDPQPVIQLLDAAGDPVPSEGYRVTATVQGGTLLGTPAVTTGPEGRAAFTGLAISGGTGPRTIVFSVPTLQPASHAITVVAGPAARIEATGPLMQPGLIGTAVAFPPAVRVVDAGGNPVAGTAVSYAVTAGGGILTGDAAVSGADGIASAGAWVLGPATGANAVVATAEGLAGSPMTFAANGVLLMPTTIGLNAGANQTAPVNGFVPVPPSVFVTGLGGAPVPGVTVTFDVTLGGGALAGADAVTNAAGIATVGSWRLGAPGGNQVRATLTGVVGSPVLFNATATESGTMIAAPIAGAGVAGEPVSSRPSVRILGSSGSPVVGVPIVFSVTAGGGSVQGADQVTNAEGFATVGGWTLGATPGTNSLEASAPPGYTGSPRVFSMQGLTQLPTSIARHAGNGQSAQVATAVPIRPAVIVKAADGTPVAGYPVEFAAPYSGSITGGSTTTNAQGIATVGSWTLGTIAGSQELTVHSGIGEVTFSVTAVPGPATVLRTLSDMGATGIVGGPATNDVYPVGVRATDAYGNSIAGVSVTFATGTGAGPGASVDGTPQATSAAGEAKPVGWTLGTVPGTYTLTAASAGLTPATLTATARSGPPASMALEAGDGQTGGVRRYLPVKPAVRVRDAYGNPTPGSVTFTVTGGGGSGGGAITSTSAGVASATWKLGSNPGVNTMRARLDANGATYDFSATAVAVTSSFTIDVRYISAISPTQQAMFTAAVARWTDIILGDVPGINVSLPAGTCFQTQPAINEIVDDVVLYVELLDIDGPGDILGSAGPCLVRSSSDLPAVGAIRLDIADVNALESSGELAAVIQHEMAHVLGFGTMWPDRGLLFGAGTTNPMFTGTAALSAYFAMGGSSNGVPVENTGGPGTADAHWRELTFNNELMTGYIGSSVNPLTALTVGSLQDLGYQVDFGTADTLTFSPNLRRAAVPGRALRELPLPGPIIAADERGAILDRRRR